MSLAQEVTPNTRKHGEGSLLSDPFSSGVHSVTVAFGAMKSLVIFKKCPDPECGWPPVELGACSV